MLNLSFLEFLLVEVTISLRSCTDCASLLANHKTLELALLVHPGHAASSEDDRQRMRSHVFHGIGKADNELIQFRLPLKPDREVCHEEIKRAINIM